MTSSISFPLRLFFVCLFVLPSWWQQCICETMFCTFPPGHFLFCCSGRSLHFVTLAGRTWTHVRVSLDVWMLVPQGGTCCTHGFSGTYFCAEYTHVPLGTRLWGRQLNGTDFAYRLGFKCCDIFLPYKVFSHLKREHSWVSLTVRSFWSLGAWHFSP